MNLATLAEAALDRFGERRAMIFEGEEIANTTFMDRARRFQNAFSEMGLGSGDVAVLFMINHPLVNSVFQGIFRTGATVVPAMFQLTVPELHFYLADTRAKCVITDTFNLHKAREAAKGVDSIQWIAIRGGKDNPAASPPEFALEGLLERDPLASPADMDPDDVAVMLYTSGTTGKPKGVMLTHTNLIASAEGANEASEFHLWDKPRLSLSAMPMAHIFGVAVMNAGYLLPDHLAESYGIQMQWFEPVKFMENIQKYKVNTIASVPTMLSLILNHPRNAEFDLSSLNEVVCGAAPLPVELARAFQERYGCRVREIYGMTENAGMASANRMSEPYRPGSAGRPYFHTKIRIVDEEGNEVPRGERGEICTKGPANMKGYHNRPDETAKVVRDGWLHTGDVGYLDEDGYLFIVDRKKDMIIRGGENIYPAELEDALYQDAAVAEAAVVGVPDPVMGENVVAFVVKKAGSEATEADILGRMAERVTRFKIPQKLIFVDALPKSGVGKVLRRVLRDQATGAPPKA